MIPRTIAQAVVGDGGLLAWSDDFDLIAAAAGLGGAVCVGGAATVARAVQSEPIATSSSTADAARLWLSSIAIAKRRVR